jgi:hypothetical protein
MCISDSLSQFYPVVWATGGLNLKPGGWSLSLRHRHFSGHWLDCSVEEFEGLTLAELTDVLLSLSAGWERADGALQPSEPE